MGNFNEDRVRLLDIANSIREIDSYLGAADFETFSKREDMREAVISQLQQIGGAAALLSDEFKDKYGEIDWDMLNGFQYAHYDQTLELDLHAIWHIVSEDLPEIMDPLMDLATVLEDDEDLKDLTLNEEDYKDVQDLQFKKELEVKDTIEDIDLESDTEPNPPRKSNMNYVEEKGRVSRKRIVKKTGSEKKKENQ